MLNCETSLGYLFLMVIAFLLGSGWSWTSVILLVVIHFDIVPPPQSCVEFESSSHLSNRKALCVMSGHGFVITDWDSI